MAKIKKLTLDELVQKKVQKEQNKVAYKEITVPSLEGALLFEKPTTDDILDTLDKIGDDESVRNCVEAFKFLIFQCCPILHDSTLQESYGAVEPIDIVSKMFDLTDLMTVGNELMVLAGIKEFDEKVKK